MKLLRFIQHKPQYLFGIIGIVWVIYNLLLMSALRAIQSNSETRFFYLPVPFAMWALLLASAGLLFSLFLIWRRTSKTIRMLPLFIITGLMLVFFAIFAGTAADTYQNSLQFRGATYTLTQDIVNADSVHFYHVYTCDSLAAFCQYDRSFFIPTTTPNYDDVRLAVQSNTLVAVTPDGEIVYTLDE